MFNFATDVMIFVAIMKFTSNSIVGNNLLWLVVWSYPFNMNMTSCVKLSLLYESLFLPPVQLFPLTIVHLPPVQLYPLTIVHFVWIGFYSSIQHFVCTVLSTTLVFAHSWYLKLPTYLYIQYVLYHLPVYVLPFVMTKLNYKILIGLLNNNVRVWFRLNVLNALTCTLYYTIIHLFNLIYIM